MLALSLFVLVAGSSDRIYAEGLSKRVGDTCKLTGEEGICKELPDCPKVYNDMIIGNMPKHVCNDEDVVPIVCCAKDWLTTSTTETTSTEMQLDLENRQQRRPRDDRPARRMCAEYAKSVYALVDPLTYPGAPPVNVSLCALESRKLIVGGARAEPQEFPHMAALGLYTAASNGSDVDWNCGGTLISDSYALTAAHCTQGVDWIARARVRVGVSSEINETSENVQEFRVAERIRHPDYKPRTKYHDLALLRLDGRVRFDAYVRPACLSLETEVAAGDRAVATGWGLIDWGEERGADKLMKVTLPIVSHESCSAAFASYESKLPRGIDPSSQLCAGEAGKDTCQGDSGGPLVTLSEDEECMYDVVGVTSFGKSCGRTEPGVYTKVANYLAWIEGIVWPDLVAAMRKEKEDEENSI